MVRPPTYGLELGLGRTRGSSPCGMHAIFNFKSNFFVGTMGIDLGLKYLFYILIKNKNNTVFFFFFFSKTILVYNFSLLNY